MSSGRPSSEGEKEDSPVHSDHGQNQAIDNIAVPDQPRAWYNTGLRIGSKSLMPYNSSFVQVVMVAFVFFLCPGMYNALNGLGGSGLLSKDASTSANSNVALYCTFATVGFFSGTIANTFGAKVTMAMGGIGYALYSSSLLCFNHTQNGGFVIAAGALLGMCAACLWAAQGIVIMGYPLEKQKGRYLAVFWAIFNLGSVIGALIPLIQTVNSQEAASVSDGTYAAFLALMLVGAILAILLMPVEKVRKSDGSAVIVKKNPTIVSEVKGLFKVLRVDPHIILLFPMFFSSNWFYTYQFNDYNLGRFNVRTRSLNNLLYWMSQIVGALTWGLVLDWSRFSRRTRAKAFHLVLFVLTMAIWGGGYAFQKGVTREDVTDGTTKLLDWTDGRKYIGPMFLYMFYGLYDAIWQTYLYWLLGALTNSSRKLALYAGFYKGLQSAGAAVVWRLDAIGIPYMNIFASAWALLVGSLLLAGPVVFKVKESTDVEEDAMFTEDVDTPDQLDPVQKVEYGA